jgi:hypothetical protein
VLLDVDFEPASAIPTGMASDITFVRAGERQEAMRQIGEWVASESQEYLMISDPYFTIRDLELLRWVPEGVQVHVITSLKSQRGLAGESRGDLEELGAIYNVAWTRLIDQQPPPTNVTVLAQPSGEPILHDRYLISANAGLKIGTSIGGVGNRPSSIDRLSAAESAAVLTQELQPWLLPFARWQGEPIQQVSFQLRGSLHR